jgi:hypothetical protein
MAQAGTTATATTNQQTGLPESECSTLSTTTYCMHRHKRDTTNCKPQSRQRDFDRPRNNHQRSSTHHQQRRLQAPTCYHALEAGASVAGGSGAGRPPFPRPGARGGRRRRSARTGRAAPVARAMLSGDAADDDDDDDDKRRNDDRKTDSTLFLKSGSSRIHSAGVPVPSPARWGGCKTAASAVATSRTARRRAAGRAGRGGGACYRRPPRARRAPPRRVPGLEARSPRARTSAQTQR